MQFIEPTLNSFEVRRVYVRQESAFAAQPSRDPGTARRTRKFASRVAKHRGPICRRWLKQRSFIETDESRRAWSNITAKMTTMEAPYTIASLPKPLDAEHGSIYASPVFSYRGLKKRKRHEVVVGVDGESLNIYNVCLRKTSLMDIALTHTRSSPSLSLPHTLFLHNRISAAHLPPSTSDGTATLLPRDTHMPPSRTRAHNPSAGSCALLSV
jgi:hypothetical protein